MGNIDYSTMLSFISYAVIEHGYLVLFSTISYFVLDWFFCHTLGVAEASRIGKIYRRIYEKNKHSYSRVSDTALTTFLIMFFYAGAISLLIFLVGYFAPVGLVFLFLIFVFALITGTILNLTFVQKYKKNLFWQAVKGSNEE